MSDADYSITSSGWAYGTGCGTIPSTAGTGSGYSTGVITVSATPSYTSSSAATISGIYSLTDTSRATIHISEHGEIYRGTNTKGNGLFERLERLERMLGILQRRRDLEDEYAPLKDLGDRYDEACDLAIGRIMDAASDQLGAMASVYEETIEQAKVYLALSKEES